MRRRWIIVGAFVAAFLMAWPPAAEAASGRVPLPLNHRLNGILVDLYRPKLFFGHERVSRGFVASRDGLVLAPLEGLEDADFGDEVKLEWMDRRTAEGWLVWKDEELGYAIVRIPEPMPLFPAMGWSQGAGPARGEELFAPGVPSGGQPALSSTVVADVRDLQLPSGRLLRGALLLRASLGSGPLSGPLLDADGRLVGMVSSLEPPAGAGPSTVVALPAEALQPDLRAARSMRPPRPPSRPPVLARPSYGIGIGIGSGGVRPRFGVGLGGVGRVGRFGRVGTYSPALDRWDRSYDPRLRNQQEATDRAKTEALERALEERSGMEPRQSASPLTNSQPLAPQGPWQAGGSSVTTSPGAGGSSGPKPQAPPRQAPSIGSTWNPAGPPVASAPPAGKPSSWPVVVEPEVPPELRTEQEETDRAKTQGLEEELARRGVEGSPPGAQGEFQVMAAPPSSRPGETSSNRDKASELERLRARTEALQRELEALRSRASAAPSSP